MQTPTVSNIRKTQTMGHIRNNLRALVDRENDRRARKGEKALTLLELSEKTGLNYGTARAWYKGHTTRYDADSLAALCEFFDVEAGEILEFVAEPV